MNYIGRPRIGDYVSVTIPGTYQRFGIVIGTDYHPFGCDDAVEIRFEGEPGGKDPVWVDARWVVKERKKCLTTPSPAPGRSSSRTKG